MPEKSKPHGEPKRSKRVNQLIEKIAKDHLQIPTLEERKMDNLDFHEVSVWGVKRALEVAYDAGRKDAK